MFDMLSARCKLSGIENQEKLGIEVQFLLLQNFSMVSFTGAVDALVTANLIQPDQFRLSTISVDTKEIKSDLGIAVSTDCTLAERPLIQGIGGQVDVLVVCGGYRCSLQEEPQVSGYLRAADKKVVRLCALWNGAVHLAYAGLLKGQKCAAHPENHAFIREAFPEVELSENSFVIAERRATSSGPISSIEMMIGVISQLRGEETVRAVREIICCDKLPEHQDSTPLRIVDDVLLPESLRSVLHLMKNNIEEPLSLSEISELQGLSTRQIERLFQTNFGTTPSRYYLSIRLHFAKRLITQSEIDILGVAIASGFVTSSHFSNCFKRVYGYSPKAARAMR